MYSNVRILTEDEFVNWDKFVDDSPKGTLFHKTSWLKASGRKFVVYGYFKNAELFAGIPVMYRRILGCRIVSHPLLTPYMGIIFGNHNAKYVKRISQEKEVIRAFAKQLKNDFHHVQFRFPPGVMDLQPLLWEGFSSSISYTYIIDMNIGLDNIWKGMEDKRRNDIRKAERDCIVIEIADNFEHTYRLVEKTFERQAQKARSKAATFRYYEALKEMNTSKSFLAKDKDNNLIAVVFLVWDNKKSYYLLGGYDSDKSHHGGSALAMWEAIKFTQTELGLKEFDFEGSMIPPIEIFFRKFGGEQVPCYSVEWTTPLLKIVVSVYKALRRIPNQMYMRYLSHK